MVDVAVSSQLQQWTFEKPALVRPQRSDSSASSPDLSHNDETLRIDPATVDVPTSPISKETLSLHERYLSSEEDLSPMEGGFESDFEDDASIHQAETHYFSARKMSISRVEKGKSFDLAVMVSYVSAGRPKMIDLATVGSPVFETSQRSASLAQLPMAAISRLRKADQASRHSFIEPPSTSSATSRSISPASSARRPSLGHLPYSHASSDLQTSPSASETSIRPTSAAPQSVPPTRSSLYIVSSAGNASPNVPFPPLTPLSPDHSAPHSFLSSDPYENATTSAASPIIKSGPHKRLRSISQKLSLAKIAITPVTKKWDSRINGRPANTTTMPPTPATPFSPATPTSTFSSPKIRLRRSSKASRPSSVRGPSPEVPPVPILNPAPRPKQQGNARLVPRGADERAPILELPPCPDEAGAGAGAAADGGSVKAKKVRKRKSLMDLL
ncbi:hypothetical protein EJ04DRAFT_230729 [Polyplosphaeria fusca]|uniref:Uncharacterized protein n=1 Tax=Polyplosphaeria fusca TaxID=682080 RepID=A0A9P4V3S8_9PLEO|nr:hypothetical protein EJ04DRAFT_230729 [Polyplosphaeria fusca]